MSYRCCVKGCDNTNDYYPSRGNYYEGKFIKFPDNPRRREKWNSALQMTGNTKRYVCSQHFPSNAWRVQDVIMNVPLAKRKLKPDAEPTLNDELLREVKKDDESDEMDLEKRKRLIEESLTAYEKKLERGVTEAINTPKYKLDDEDEPVADITLDDKWDDEMLIEDCDFRLFQTRKCGEVTVDIDEHTFALNCCLCTDVCVNFDEFVCHIKEQHAKFLNPKQETEDEHLTSTISNIIVMEAEPLQQILENSDADDDLVAEHEGDDDNEDSGEDAEDEEHTITECNSSPDDNLETTSDIATDLGNELFITKTIEQLKKNPILWKSSNPFRKRKDATIAILHDLNASFPNLGLTYKTLSNVLLKLCQGYRYDRRHMEMSKQQNYEYEPKYWFFRKMLFLGCADPKEERRKFKYDKFTPILDTIGTENESPLIDLIEMYEQLPSLWNINDEKYRGKLKNSESMLELFEFIQEKHCSLEIRTRAHLIKLLNLLNRWFSAEEKTRIKSVWTDSSYESRFPRLYMSLGFLRGHVAPFQCDICRQSFATEDGHEKHTKSPAGGTGCAGRLQDVVNECEYCGKRFRNPQNLKTHIRQHTNERPYKCELCDSTFSDYSTFYRHGRIHTKLKPFKCNVCNSSYYTNYLLLEHQKTHLGIRDVVCDVCGKAFTDTKNLYTHRRKVHLKPSSGVRDKVCNVCGKAFTNTKYLRQHKQIHAKKKAYVCNVCGKEFAQCAGLHGHMKSHGPNLKMPLDRKK